MRSRIISKVASCPQAVQDFASMCQERDAEEVKGVLPYWPRIYCKISVVSRRPSPSCLRGTYGRCCERVVCDPLPLAAVDFKLCHSQSRAPV